MTKEIVSHEPSPITAPLSSPIREAIADFISGATEWRIWYLMATTEIKMRYKRSKLGQFWITGSNAINVLALGIIWSYLFKMEVQDYMPYVAVNFFLWTLLSSVITEGCQMFITGARYIQQLPLKKSSFAYMNVFRNVLVFSHNLIVLAFVFLFFRVPIGSGIFAALLGFALLIINAVWVSLLTGMICARFRDFANIITSLLQIVFYVTPVMWKLESMPPKIVLLSSFNPVNIFMTIVRDGLFNRAPNFEYWASALLITVIGWSVTMLAFMTYRKRIVFWV